VTANIPFLILKVEEVPKDLNML